jgi:hypothetical protein
MVTKTLIVCLFAAFAAFAWHFPRTVTVLVALPLALLAFLMFLMNKMRQSIQAVPPPSTWVVPLDECSLFKFLPDLRGRVAWRPLGTFPTPTQRAELTLPSGKKRHLYCKREDLSHDTLYSGNKVRTLEFQLACASAMGKRRLLTVGAAGSNQTVAVAAHLRNSYPEMDSQVLLLLPEAKNVETGINAFSSLTLSALAPAWMLGCMGPLLSGLFLRRDTCVSPPGGANVPGALGHVAALLEAVSIVPNVAHIVLPHGSGCTLAGLMVGIAVARKIGFPLRALKHVHGVVVHPMFAAMNGLIPSLLVTRLAAETAEALRRLGGPDVTAELASLMQSDIRKCVVAHCGEYGSPTEKSLLARDLPLRLEDDPVSPLPWRCHTFSSKALGYLVDCYETGAIAEDEEVVFWCTKTLIQPAAATSADPFSHKDVSPHLLQFMRDSDVASSDQFYTHARAKRV